MQMLSVNQLGALEGVAGKEMRVLLWPGEADATSVGSFTKPGIFYSIAAKSEHPREAAMLLDYLVNSPESAAVQKFDRGVPVNATVLEEIAPQLSSAELRIAEYYDRVNALDPQPFPIANADAGPVFTETFARMTQEVLFDRLTPDQAAQQLVDAVTAEL
jgi:multiple sugar transport system substrate-binding protein